MMSNLKHVGFIINVAYVRGFFFVLFFSERKMGLTSISTTRIKSLPSHFIMRNDAWCTHEKPPTVN